MSRDTHPTFANHVGVTSEVLQEVRQHLRAHKWARLKKTVAPLHASDIANIIQLLDGSERNHFIPLIPAEALPEVLAELEDHFRPLVLERLNPQQLANAITELDTGDAVELIEELDDDVKEKALSHISKEDREVLEKALQYAEKTAGRIMQTDVPCVPGFWTVGEALDYIAKTTDLPDTYYDLYIVDPRDKPQGIVSLTQLVREERDVPLAKIIDENIRLIPADMDQEKVAQLFRQYGLVSAPIVNTENHIIGMITVDDIVHVITEEAQEDLLNLAGVRESDFYAGPVETTYQRIPWLVITMVNVMISIFVLSHFRTLIDQVTALAFYLPVSAAMAGNSGLQVITIIVRALATQELRKENQMRTVIKELTVANFNGIIFALVFGTLASYWESDVRLGLVVGGALIFNMILAGLAGTLLPVMLRRLDMDPAIGAGPMLTILTDVLGYFIYLSLATLIFGT
ncbi:MAG: magnesium transporter [Alphaproteobacteria bacterium]|nr:MAG: magnesium transporter [Alphaproteobacteria bacterium]